jgi:hypothetical protein
MPHDETGRLRRRREGAVEDLKQAHFSPVKIAFTRPHRLRIATGMPPPLVHDVAFSLSSLLSP